MPYQIIDKGTYYMVVNKETGAIKSRHSTLDNAKAQVRILEGFKPGQGIEKAKKKVKVEEKIKYI